MRVLAIDGGGVRGLLPARVLAEVESRTGRACHELFDLIVGTSTGGIIALAVATPRPGGTTPWTAEEVVHFYDEHCPRIFEHHLFDFFDDAQALLHERYHPDGLEEALTCYFGDRMLSDAIIPVAVPAYDLVAREPMVLRSRLAAEPLWDLPVRLAARATSAAPTFFPPLHTQFGDRKRIFVDGGVFANNPSMCAYIEAESLSPGSQIRLLSLGTGDGELPANWAEVHEWGLAEWARPLVHVVMDGVSRIVHSQLSSVLSSNSYCRIQIELTSESAAMDDASPANLARLHDHSSDVIKQFDRELDGLCVALSPS